MNPKDKSDLFPCFYQLLPFKKFHICEVSNAEVVLHRVYFGGETKHKILDGFLIFCIQNQNGERKNCLNFKNNLEGDATPSNVRYVELNAGQLRCFSPKVLYSDKLKL